MTKSIVAIDQGTTNSKAFLFSTSGAIIAQASRPMSVSYPTAGWAELDSEVIWSTVRDTINEVCTAQSDSSVQAIAVSNQRESILLWNGQTGEALGPCVIWQCRRSSDLCTSLRDQGAEPLIVEKSGLGIDPLFPAAKLAWLLDTVPQARDLAAKGYLRAGTVDSWLLWKLTGGTVHATDASNASRTQLMNIDSLRWDSELADLFNVPISIMPTIMPSNALFGHTASGVTALPAGTPIQGVMGDSHAALFGHGIRHPGSIKATLGTGSSLMALTGARIRSSHGLSSTIAWSSAAGGVHALEGNISVSGQTAAFATQMLNLTNEAALTDLALTVPDNGGVCFVPALAGLGAPHWKDRARGLIAGLSLATQPAHIARAALEAIALQIRDVFVAMDADLNAQHANISVDGGASQNDVLMQLLADVLDCKVLRPAIADVTALGVARMAGEALGIWRENLFETASMTFVPKMSQHDRTRILTQWCGAIERTKL
jgi:glycerol kinase